MGCGISRHYPGEDRTACGLQTPFRRKIKELQNDPNAIVNRTSISCPEGADFCYIGDVKGRKSVAQRDENFATRKVVGEDIREGDMLKDVDEDEDEELDGARISNFDVSMWVGSPSFREYCVVPHCDSSDDHEDDDMQENNTHEEEKKVHEEDKNEGSGNRTTSRRIRGRRFRKVFPMHAPAAVKNLMK